MAAAHGGVLHLSAVNLLSEHLVEVLLDVATSGVNRVERRGIWHEHPARFVLVASMDPDAGELRPQLLDRFGLAVDVTTPADPAMRAEVVRRRLTHDSGGLVDGHEGDIVLRARLAAAMPADLPTSVVDFGCHLAAGLGAEGLRGDLVLCRAAAAFAGWEGRSITTEADVERVVPLALGHRRRRRPFHPPALVPGELERALEAARQAFVAVGNGAGGGGGDDDGDGEPAAEPSSDDDQPMTAATSSTPATPDDATAGEEGEPAEEREPDGESEGGEEPEGERQPGEELPSVVEARQAEAVGEKDDADPLAAGHAEAPGPAADLGEDSPGAEAGREPRNGVDEVAATPPPSSAGTGEPAAQGS